MRPCCHCAIILISVLFVASLVQAQSPYSCPLPTLTTPPNPPPPSQTPCDPFGTPACGPCTSGSTCTVTTMLELTRALYCRVNGGQCTHIIVPSTATIAFSNQIFIGNAAVPLELTINGTLLWVGPQVPNNNGGSTPTLISVNNVVDAPVTINGSGMITSLREPCQDPFQGTCLAPNSSARIHIGYGIKITNSNNVSVTGVINGDGTNGPPLKFQRLSTAVLVEGDNSDGLTFKNLDIKGMTQYGIFVGANAADEKIKGVTIEDCHVQGAYDQHGFRVYASDVVIQRCTACQLRASGVWVVQGKNITIDDFKTDEYVRIGPNFDCPDSGPEKGERVINANVSDINADYVEVHSGVIGCMLTGLETYPASGAGLKISKAPGGNTVARPNNRIHWNVPQGTVVQINGSTYHSTQNPSGVNGTDISPCVGDVNDDNAVNVTDLLAVISAWGPCPERVGACWFDNLCHPHWTATACTAASGEFKGVGTDCWTHEASAPCCTPNGSNWSCEPNVLPSACWKDGRKYLGTSSSCAGVNCATIASTLPPCTLAVVFPQFPCQADIMPASAGDWQVNVTDLLAVISDWGCTPALPLERGTAPKSVSECEADCATADPTYGEQYARMLQACIESLRQQDLIE